MTFFVGRWFSKKIARMIQRTYSIQKKYCMNEQINTFADNGFIIIRSSFFLTDILSQMTYFSDQWVSLQTITGWSRERDVKIYMLCITPRMYPIYIDEIHSLLFGAYRIFYSIDDNNKTISILRFASTSRDTETILSLLIERSDENSSPPSAV